MTTSQFWEIRDSNNLYQPIFFIKEDGILYVLADDGKRRPTNEELLLWNLKHEEAEQTSKDAMSRPYVIFRRWATREELDALYALEASL